jgi:cytoskeletal protein CcmA (bactofilin family)
MMKQTELLDWQLRFKQGVVVGGRVEGNIKTTEIVEIKDKGQTLGEMSTPKLSISEGAIFDGRSIILPKN